MMTGEGLLAVSFGQPVEWLAIAGGAALGAFVCGVATQLLCRWTTGKKLPPFPLLTVRILGGVAAGVVTAMLVLNGGGNGWWPFGGPGGAGDHAGQTPNNGQKPEQPTLADTNPAPAVPPDKENPAPTPSENTMRVDVMTLEMLDEPAKSQARAGRPYRLPESPDPKALHTLKEVEDAVQERLGKQPPLQLLVVTGPNQDAGWMQPLIDWAKARRIKVRPESW